MNVLIVCAAIATITGNVFLVWLTFRMIWLIKRDKEKKLSLLELQQQTKTLAESFKTFIRPNLVVREMKDVRSIYDHFDFNYTNSGGGCYNMKVTGSNLPEGATIDLINNDSIATGSVMRGLIIYNNRFAGDVDYQIDMSFDDIEGTTYRQTLHLRIIAKRNKQTVSFSPPVRL